MVNATEIFHFLCWMLECQMATVNEQKERPRTPKYIIERHESIVQMALNEVVGYCEDYGFGIDPKYSRVKKAVDAVLENL